MTPPNLSDKSPILKSPKLLDQVRDKLRVKHYSIRIENAYVAWIKRYLFFHGKRQPCPVKFQDRKCADWRSGYGTG